MANPAFMNVVIKGNKREILSLYWKMKRLQERKSPLVGNNFYYPHRWLGCLVTRLGGDRHEIYCRGTWSDLRIKDNCLFFSTETAWNPPLELLKLIEKVYPTLKIYYEAEGDNWDSYITNDTNGKYFPARYVVDFEPDMEYFDTIEEACTYLSNYIGEPVETTWDALNLSAEKWNDEHPDAEWFINVKEIIVI